MTHDIIDWLETELGPVKLNTRATDYFVNCPLCEYNGKSSDTKFHLSVAVNKSVFRCFRCGSVGTYLDLILQITGAESYAEAGQYLTSPRVHLDTYESIAERLERKETVKLPPPNPDLPQWFHPLTDLLNNPDSLSYREKLIAAYAMKRMSYKNIVKHQLGYSSPDADDIYQFCVLLPVEGSYFQARSIFPRPKRKYINPTESIGGRLFNCQALERYKIIYIAEGIFSALAIGRSAIATLGNKATNEQRRRLGVSSCESFIICYDSDAVDGAGQLDLAEYLSARGKRIILRQYVDGDPDDGGFFTEVDYTFKYKVNATMNISFNTYNAKRIMQNGRE